MDMTTTYLGLNLRTPLVASASPISQEISNIRKMEDAGASAVVLFSLFEEQIIKEQQALFHHMHTHSESFAEALTYFPEPDGLEAGPENYLNHIRKAKGAVDIPIIASLNGDTPGGWTDFAQQIEQAGADALELNIYAIATDFDKSGAQIEEETIDIVRSVRSAVKIPLAVKISPFYSSLPHMARRLFKAGADGLVLFNRFYQPDVDIEALEVYPHVLLSTPQANRLPLRWIGILYDRIEVDFAATSGIQTPEDAIKMVMVGANVAMMASAILQHGIEHFRVMETGMRHWLEEHEYESVTQMRGSMSQVKSGNSANFERAQYTRAVSNLPSQSML